ncbi:uncharacterized protein LOC123705055 isoform X2 [Colias croceus]|nr:uncharacterized protein LOC123705055 isoform X2 [Colias croceus]
MSWAMFCYPDKDWFDLQALADLQKSCKVICSKHFADSAYTTPAKIRLHKSATPSIDEENLHSPRAGPSHSNICNFLRTQSHTVMSVTEEPTAEIKTESVTSGSFAARSQTVTEELSADIKTESVPSVSSLPQSQMVAEEPAKEIKSEPSVSFLKKESLQNKGKLSASENKVYNKCKLNEAS